MNQVPRTDQRTITQWSEAFLTCRRRHSVTVGEVSRRAGVSKREVSDWEEGLAYPRTSRVLWRIYGIMPSLRQYNELLPEQETATATETLQPQQDEQDAAEDSITAEAAATRAIEEAGRPSEPIDYAEAIKIEREKNNITKTELAEMLEVHVRSVTFWETREWIPIQTHWEELVRLFPSLGKYACPCRDKVKSGIPTGTVRPTVETVALVPAIVTPKTPLVSSVEEAAIAYARQIALGSENDRKILAIQAEIDAAKTALKDAMASAAASSVEAARLHAVLLAAASKPRT